MNTASLNTAAAPLPPAVATRSRLNPKFLPLIATLSLFVAMATLGSVLYTGFFSAQGVI